MKIDVEKLLLHEEEIWLTGILYTLLTMDWFMVAGKYSQMPLPCRNW
jgi:hypothetical protein